MTTVTRLQLPNRTQHHIVPKPSVDACSALRGITRARPFDRGLKVLIQQGLVQKQVFKFRERPTHQVRLPENAFLAGWSHLNTAEGVAHGN